MRVVIVKSGGYLDNVVLRILSNNAINGDLVSKITRNTIIDYDAILFTYQNKIPNIPKLIEQIALEKQIQVFYISNTMAIGQFYNLINDIYFNFIEEMAIELSLPAILKTSVKFHKHIKMLQNDYKEARDELTLLKLTNKAKRILIKKGLSEEESHKFIINKAMELRIPKKKLVNLIIENKIDI